MYTQTNNRVSDDIDGVTCYDNKTHYCVYTIGNNKVSLPEIFVRYTKTTGDRESTLKFVQRFSLFMQRHNIRPVSEQYIVFEGVRYYVLDLDRHFIKMYANEISVQLRENIPTVTSLIHTPDHPSAKKHRITHHDN